MIDKEHNAAAVNEWIRSGGDNTLRINYDLTPESVIFDIGGFKGDWAHKMLRYNSTIHIFEPVKTYADQITARFDSMEKVFVHATGVGSQTDKYTIYFPAGQDEATLHPDDLGQYESTEVTVTDVVDVFRDLDVDFVDLMKINIEGHEFELLDSLISSDLHKKVGNIQVQFHKIDEDSVDLRNTIRAKLSRTHVCTYNYEFVWENWELK
jgi:FkbM family methyltransferase